MLSKKIKPLIPTSCFTGVGEIINCPNCFNKLIKHGKTRNGKQRYFCNQCLSSKVLNPTKPGYGDRFNKRIIVLTKEGLSIRSTARVLNISPATIIRKLLEIANRIQQPEIPDGLQRVQVDELHTIVRSKKKEIYIIYSWSQELKLALSMTVGTRSKTTLRKVVNPLLETVAEFINTDGYSGYKGVVPKKKHTTLRRKNNGIERQNLNLRTHLKRLNRRTICFSRSELMLEAILKIYFWG